MEVRVYSRLIRAEFERVADHPLFAVAVVPLILAFVAFFVVGVVYLGYSVYFVLKDYFATSKEIVE
jgi:hypothetical protein